MSGPGGESAGISPRRALFEEVFARRFLAVAELPSDEGDPPSTSGLWAFGAGRCATRAALGDLESRRAGAMDLAVLALAWLEAIDRELPAERGAGGQDDVVGDGP